MSQKKEKVWTYKEISSPHIMFFKIFGLVPLEKKLFNFIDAKFLNIYWVIISILHNTMTVTYGINMIIKKRFEISYISELLVGSSTTIRYILIYYKRQQFLRIITMCRELWPHILPSETVIMRSFERIIFYIWATISVVIFIIFSSFTLSSVMLKYEPIYMNETQPRTMPFKFYVDIYDRSWYIVAVIYQIILESHVSLLTVGMEPIEFYLILTACGYLRSLQTRLILMSEDQNEVNTNSKENLYTIELMYHEIVKCAKFHQSIMLYSEEVEDFMRSIYFVCVATNIYNISFVGISLLKETDEQSVKWFILLIWNIAQFYTYQWSPEYLLTESEAIVYGAYHLRSKLIGQHPKSDKILHFLIMRAQKPIQLTAGGYIKLSLETFTNMIKSAISLFTLLRTFDI